MTTATSSATAWQGMSDDEATQFVDDAIALLKDTEMVAQFTENVAKVGIWANEIDEAFDRVNRTFSRIVAESGADFPKLLVLQAAWNNYNDRWVAALLLSRDVASEHVALLKRFEQVFLDMVLQIETEQDRLDVSEELKLFIDEEHDNSDKMSRVFLDLSRDVGAFSTTLNNFIEEEGTKLSDAINELQPLIDNLNSEIAKLNKKIDDARKALAISGGLLNVIGLVVSGSLLASWTNERNDKEADLRAKQRQMAELNRKQQSLAFLQTDFSGIKPDLELICDRLLGFAGIWSSVRSQSVQFRVHIQGGLDAATNTRFKREVQLAQDTCVPLRAGLEQYAQNLNRKPTA